MNRIYAVCAAGIVAAVLTACNQTAAPAANTVSTHDADVQAIRDGERQWVQDYASKDAGKVAAHYADDAVFMVPGLAAASGKDEIQKMLQGMVSDPALDLKFEASKIEVANSGDLGYTRGTYTVTMTDSQTKKPIHDHGSYVTAYRKQADGSWKAVADIATSELPITAPAPMKKH